MGEPWFRFFTKDWIIGVASLSGTDRGVYISILALIYDSNGPIKRDDVGLARCCGVPTPGLTRSLDRLISAGKLTIIDGFLSNARAVQECLEREDFVVMTRNRALSGWEKRKQNQRLNLNTPTHHQSHTQSHTQEDSVSYETLVKTPVEDGVLPLAAPLSNDAKERRKNDVDLCQDVVADWNALAADLGLPVVRDITTSRQAAIKSRSEDFKRTYDYADPRVGFSELMARVRRSPFLRGDVRDFRCDFDFVVRASSFTKIMEGRYETQERAKGKR